MTTIFIKCFFFCGGVSRKTCNFTEFSLPNTPTNVPILKHLPENAASLDMGAFAASSQTIFSSPLDSPLHGSCLTPSQLLTPVNSPRTTRWEWEWGKIVNCRIEWTSSYFRQLSSGDGNGTAPLSPLLNIHKSLL